ncbi:MAG: hypothetical protein ACLPID_16140 [Beijerinckiaceae bacterium]
MTKRVAAVLATLLIVWTAIYVQPALAQTGTTGTEEPEGSSGCLYTGRVFGLDPYGDNFLSVRRRPNGPSGAAYEVDQLFTNDQVCVAQTAGRWLFVKYQRAGRMFSGWVFDKYIREE